MPEIGFACGRRIIAVRRFEAVYASRSSLQMSRSCDPKFAVAATAPLRPADAEHPTRGTWQPQSSIVVAAQTARRLRSLRNTTGGRIQVPSHPFNKVKWLSTPALPAQVSAVNAQQMGWHHAVARDASRIGTSLVPYSVDRFLMGQLRATQCPGILGLPVQAGHDGHATDG